MIWLLLWIIWTFFSEINNSITKNKTEKYHFLKVWVISSFFWVLIFILSWAYKYYFTDIDLYLNKESIALLATRLVFEILQSYFTILALKHCDRSTFSIIRILTIPLLVIADIMLWYQFTTYSLIWIWVIITSFILFNSKSKTLNFKWWYYILFTAVNAVLTLSLFKYSITHYWNSVEIDQLIMITWIFIFFIIYNYRKNKCCAIKLIVKEKLFLLQWLAIWLSSLILSYSYLYLNASEATAVIRAWEMFWAIIAWTIFFKEDNIIKKLLFAFFIIAWLIIMVI